MHILTLGLNHTTAPVAVREKLALPDHAVNQALGHLVDGYGMHEAAILSTCNRSEIYIASDRSEALAAARRYLSEVRGVDVDQLSSHFYELSDAVVELIGPGGEITLDLSGLICIGAGGAAQGGGPLGGGSGKGSARGPPAG